MAEIAHRTNLKNNRVLFIIHRKEVLEQAINTFKQQEVDLNLTKLGMVQTLTRHVDSLIYPQLIMIDEAHHALAKSYRRILNAFPKAYVLLFTATPRRTGREQLDQIADDIVVGKSIKELTSEGFLAPFKYWAPNVDIDSRKLKRSSTGDFTKKSMDAATHSTIYGNAVKNYQKYCNNKQAVVYTYSIDSANKLANKFNEAGISAKSLSSKTPTDLRERIVNSFRHEKIKILVNVNLFTEGVDLPNVDSVIMCRPTQSLSLFLQFSMRCLNPRKGKTATIIDQVENWKRFGLPNEDRNWKQAMITKQKVKRKTNTGGGPSITQCPFCFGVIDRQEIKDNKCPLCGDGPVTQEKTLEHKESEFNQITEEIAKQARKRYEMEKKAMQNNVMQNVMHKTIHQLYGWEEFKAYAKLHGYANGWAWIMFNKRKKGLI